MKMFKVVIAISFTVGIWVPLLCWRFDWDSASTWGEHRHPNPLPKFRFHAKDLKTLPAQLDAYFEDRFGLRHRLIHLYSRLYVFGLGVSPSPKVFLGKEEWLFYRGEDVDREDPIRDFLGTRPLSRSRLEGWRWMVEDQSEWLNEQGIRYLLVLVPGKPDVYPEYMPDYFRRVGPVTPLQQLTTYLHDHTTVPFLDLTPTLRDAKPREAIYWRTDSHWTAYGAYVGCQAIADALSEWFPHAKPVPESAYYRQEDWWVGDLARMISLPNLLRERFSAMVPRDPKRAGALPADHLNKWRMTSSVDEPNLPRAAVFRDSFGEQLAPHLAMLFNEAWYVWDPRGVDVHLVQETKPDVVIQEVGSRQIRGGLRYPRHIQWEMAERRFMRATHVVANCNGTEGFAAIRPYRDSELTRAQDQLVIHSAGAYPRVRLPDLSEVSEYLLIVHVDITAPADASLILSWHRSSVPDRGERIREQIRAGLQKGRNHLYIPLRDPEIVGPLRLGLTTGTGDYLLHALEVRGVPR